MIHGPPLAVPGFTASGTACGIKKTGATDLALIASETPAAFAATFTRNVVQAAPVTWTRRVHAGGVCQAIVANSGNANACTGPQGEEDARGTAALVGQALGLPETGVAVASTGVIGQPLPMAKLRQGIPRAAATLAPSGWEAAAEAIRTTDLVTKYRSTVGDIDGRQVTLTGIAKGSGMIHPDMATMLCFLATDAPVAQEALQGALVQAVGRTFNRITVDGATSTNDCVLLLAGGAAGGPPLTPETPGWDGFRHMVYEVCDSLAAAIVADGEGATKRVTLTVTGLPTEADAVRVARCVAASALVKTALFGGDPNWGRLLAAAGQAGVHFDPSRAVIHIGDQLLLKDGRAPGPEAEAAAAGVMATRAYGITLELGGGPGAASVRTCDLSYDYVRINADYRS